MHPCVPVDYPTVPRALAVSFPRKSSSNGAYSQYISRSNNQNKKEQVRSVHIFLRPGKHLIKESLVISATEDVNVTIQTMELPENRFYSPRLAFAEQEYPQSHPHPPKPKGRGSPFRQFMGCRSMSSVEARDTEQPYDSDSSDSIAMYSSNDDSVYVRNTSIASNATTNFHRSNSSSSLLSMPPPKYPDRATLVLRTRRQNEPIIRVCQGNFKLSKIDLEHGSQGVDIWNGNAAVQVQPPLGTNNEPLPVIPRPMAVLDNVAISSKSGRGVVCLDGGNVKLQECMIYDCAATGLYIGGPGSAAEMTLTDIIRNGIGSRLPSSRAPRVTAGHSGIYLEQGTARIQECNISSNCLTGISAVSHDNAILLLEKTDLVANGQHNLEMPPPGTNAYDLSDISNNNNMASVGRPCLRSNLELPGRSRGPAAF